MKNKRAAEILGVRSRLQSGRVLAALMAAGLLLSGCGQKGPLVLPAALPTKAVGADTEGAAVRNANPPATPSATPR
jgi:predicted small lipoprotein YifL